MSARGLERHPKECFRPTLSVRQPCIWGAGLICWKPLFPSMSQGESEDEGMFVDCEVVHDSIGVTHFLPPKRCKNCED